MNRLLMIISLDLNNEFDSWHLSCFIAVPIAVIKFLTLTFIIPSGLLTASIQRSLRTAVFREQVFNLNSGMSVTQVVNMQYRK